ncbi:MAG: hypothetical protein E6G94_09725 [Alphaproteobacteria bacterium]|nr:MAG: hypothetical protein E6G94_09725 [Alphaproteobacteria bacterium]
MEVYKLTKQQVELALALKDFVRRQQQAVATPDYNVARAEELLEQARISGLPDAAWFDLFLQIQQHRHEISGDFYPSVR